MAKAEAVTEVVKYNLELSKDEAETLRDVLGRVTGNEVRSRRKYAQAVLNALTEAGVEPDTNDQPYGTLRFEQSIYDQTW